MTKQPRQNALVKLEEEYAKFLKSSESDIPLIQEEVFIFLGEIPNMPGHCVVAGHKSGRIYSGYHVENFLELTEDEL